ncbi:MAG: HAMP domain-containing protein [Anaerolineae bacterium]|nr:HAMP domain-containing protein [Anaerolineae bacterium]
MKRLWVRLSVAFSSVILLFVILIMTFGIMTGLNGRALPPVANKWMKELEILPPELQQQEIRLALTRLYHGLITLVIVNGTVGLAAGIWMSRTLAEPLNRLAEAARTLGAGDLSRRVDIKGSQEMVDVAVAFNQMAAALEKATELRRNLMADVAHELRTPVTVLQGNLRAMLDDVYDMDKAEIARLYEQTRHLIQLIEDLRIVALAESHQLPLNLEDVDVEQLLQEVYANFEPIAVEETVKLTLHLPDEKLLLTQVDAARMKQILYNLMSNAMRHTPEGGEIDLRAGLVENEIALTISDTGEGIASEHLNRVFDRFYRTDPTRARDTGGTGLGLAIVKALTEAHHGHVGVSSRGYGKGSVFTIRLPLHRPA